MNTTKTSRRPTVARRAVMNGPASRAELLFLRTRIDAIDEKIVDLILRRGRVAYRLTKMRAARRRGRERARERDVIRKVLNRVGNNDNNAPSYPLKTFESVYRVLFGAFDDIS